jgi:hypothetical protein
MVISELELSFSKEGGPDDPEAHISLAEFEKYCTLFEGLLDELERNESASSVFRGADLDARGLRLDDLDLEGCLDEFDYAEIEEMKKRHWLS